VDNRKDGSPRVAPRRPSAASAASFPSRVLIDPVMVQLDALARSVAAGNISVLLTGETGCGKEVFAEVIHRASPRADKPFLSLNCAALSEALLESELFGYERGAFTGATHAKAGLLESAEGGTVFLDELGEMPPSLQAKLLRALEQRHLIRVGGLKSKPVDVRFVSATNRDLEAEVARGTFRRDLFYRINGATLFIPPLRERPSEIEPLARMFAERASRELARQTVPGLSPDAVQALLQHDWPGNIRELKNVMDRALLVCRGPAITRPSLHLVRGRTPAPTASHWTNLTAPFRRRTTS
jgi:two-component system, NtrC family, response regulator AtoC